MSWEYINYDYTTAYLFQKMLFWVDKNCNIYFATKLNSDDAWTYYSGNASHTLQTGSVLAEYSSETDAQTNYYTTVRDTNGKVLCVLPSIVQAKYIRLYVQSGSNVRVYEFKPSTFFTAHEIISGELHITDQLSDAPKIRVTKSGVDRVKVGNLNGSVYGIAGYDSTATKIFELSNARQNLAGWDFTATHFTKNNVTISSNGNITLGSGGDLILEANATTPGRIVFSNPTSDFFFGTNKVNSVVSLSPVASNFGTFRLGDVGWWGKYWKDIYIRSKEDVEIQAGDNNDFCSITFDADNSPNISQWKCQPSANNSISWNLYSNTETYMSIYDSSSEIYKLRIWRDNPHTYSAIEMESAGATDNLFVFESNSVDRFTFGVDASDGYKYKIAEGFGLSANNRFWISAVGSTCITGSKLILGSGAAGVDFSITFNGETNDGVVTWKEDEDYFEIGDEVFINDRLGVGRAYTTDTIGLFYGGTAEDYPYCLTIQGGSAKAASGPVLAFKHGYATEEWFLGNMWGIATGYGSSYEGGLGFAVNAGGSASNLIGGLYIAKGGVTVGSGVAGTDYTLTFDGETNDGIITWMEDEDYFKFSDDILMDSEEKIQFRDTNIYIFSDDDGYLDFAADTGIRSTKAIRTTTSLYRRYYHISLDSANPGASGATWVSPGANSTGGWRLDAASETLHGSVDVHADWDGASDLTAEVRFYVNVNNTGGGAGDTVDLKLVCYYKGVGDTVTKTQTVEVATVVGASAQYKAFKADFTIDWDAASNVVEAGDVIGMLLNLETDTSEVDDIVVTGISFSYPSTHIGIEAGDI